MTTESHTPAPKAVEALPELPPPADYIEVCRNVAYAYTPEQMREYARTAVSASLAAAQAEQAKPHHHIYTTTDKGRPVEICDRNGEVVLSQCKVCGKAEAELEAPCTAAPKVTKSLPELLEELAFETKTYDEEGFTLNPDAAVIFDQIKQHFAAISPQPPSPDVEHHLKPQPNQALSIDSRGCEHQPSPDVERQAVAWQFALDSGKWATIYASELDYFRGRGRKVRPLYAHPPQEAGDADAERQAVKLSVARLLEDYKYGQFSDDMLDHLSPDCRSPAKATRKNLHAVLEALQNGLLVVAARSPQQEPKA